jgi:hypothetical protein
VGTPASEAVSRLLMVSDVSDMDTRRVGRKRYTTGAADALSVAVLCVGLKNTHAERMRDERGRDTHTHRGSDDREGARETHLLVVSCTGTKDGLVGREAAGGGAGGCEEETAAEGLGGGGVAAAVAVEAEGEGRGGCCSLRCLTDSSTCFTLGGGVKPTEVVAGTSACTGVLVARSRSLGELTGAGRDDAPEMLAVPSACPHTSPGLGWAQGERRGLGSMCGNNV